MTTNAVILGLLAESPIHPGSGRGMGVVDLPVAREVATDYPVLVGSSLKGALRQKANVDQERQKRHFGHRDHAGDLLVSDGRLLLLPVRNLTGIYRWATCPYLIERFSRDRARSGQHHPQIPTPKPESTEVLAKEGSGTLFLEERQFSISGAPTAEIVDAIKPLLLHEETRNRLPEQLVVLNDNDFAWFARYGLAIQARNVLNDDTKTSKNLWYEETLPPDTVMYALIAARGDLDARKTLRLLLPESSPYLQAGGNETVGQGWFAVSMDLPAGEGGGQ